MNPSIPAVAVTGRRSDLTSRVTRLLRSNVLALVGAILLVAAAIAAPALLTASNLGNMLLQFAPLGIVVIGQMLVILVRGLDLSVASVMATSAVVATSFSGLDADLVWILPTALGLGALVGAINGLLVTKRNVSPFLATLATMIVLQGARNAYTQGAPSGNVPPLLRSIGSGVTAGIPNNVIVLLAVAALAYILLHVTTFGRRIYLTGGSPRAAQLVGITVDRVTISAYVLSGALAALAGLVLSGYVSVVDNWVGKNFELDSIVAAVMGGVALSGGKGTALGALMGAAILVVLSNAVVILGMPIHVQLVMKGFIIVLAAALYIVKSKGTR
ncbi:ABC transporter permease [Variovorax sp. PAMC28562]|nr:ABC transporter permease [Variovorax sp. PAMC28562]